MNRNFLTYLFISFLALGLSLTACQTQQSTEDTTGETTADTTTSEDPPAEDKSKRASPPAEAAGNIGGVNVSINYGSPAVKGRTVWGDLVTFGEVWRTGANEATTFEVDNDVMVNGKLLNKGKYGLFTIPAQDGDWTVIFNTVWDQWGAYEYKGTQDALRVTATPSMAETSEERMGFTVGDDGTVVFAWDKLRLPFTVAAAGEGDGEGQGEGDGEADGEGDGEE